MNEEALNISMRKFLKRVGVTSQQEIEKALRAASEAGTLDSSTVAVNVTLTIPDIDLRHEVDGELALKANDDE